jgi:hypothetical protein
LPDEARVVSSFITEKSAVKSPAAIAGTEADDADGLLLLLGELLLQAASPNPTSMTAVVAATLLSRELIVPPFPRPYPREARLPRRIVLISIISLGAALGPNLG